MNRAEMTREQMRRQVVEMKAAFPGLNTRARNALLRGGHTPESLREASDEDILGLDSVGVVTLEHIRFVLGGQEQPRDPKLRARVLVGLRRIAGRRAR